MRKLLCVLALGLCAAPAAAHERWSEFVPASHHPAYVYVVGSEHGRLNRLPSRHEGYFHQRGTLDVRNGRALFEYDRDYPYDYPSYAWWDHGEAEQPRGPSCTMERVPDAAGGLTEVRVCRN